MAVEPKAFDAAGPPRRQLNRGDAVVRVGGARVAQATVAVTEPPVGIVAGRMQPGGSPGPVVTNATVPGTYLHRLATGATVPADRRASPGAPTIDGSAPA